ncbi:hypothetical protein BH18ACI2_BH18ACI2_29610 [soil metagenome]
MIGNSIADASIADCGLRIADCSEPASLSIRKSPAVAFNPQSVRPQSKGFTLLELMIVISIIVILAAVVLPQYQKTVLQASEAVLRDDLFQMRKILDQYAADKGELPQSLDQLVEAGYLREVPVDPITGERNWVIVTGSDINSSTGGQGITDIRSAATEPGSDGRAYSEW